jgi:hypothetical protein
LKEASMKIHAEPFWVPKKGNQEKDYEDAVWPQERQEYTDSCVRFAVADGATESSYARRWADLLVRAVGEGRLSPAFLPEGLAPMRADWRQWMAGLILPWYAEEKVARGAFAALVVLELITQESGSGSEGCWHAAALGDSCLFQVRSDDVLARFPMDHSAAFDNRPFLLSSVQTEGECLANRVFHLDGTWAQGDVFYLMTDALAWWFLHKIEAGSRPWDDLRHLTPPDGPNPFPAWIASLRDQSLIRNDDCTLLRIILD